MDCEAINGQSEVMKIELEPGIWLASGQGDLLCTLLEEHAREFGSMKDARKALKKARKFRKFEAACIQEQTF